MLKTISWFYFHRWQIICVFICLTFRGQSYFPFFVGEGQLIVSQCTANRLVFLRENICTKSGFRSDGDRWCCSVPWKSQSHFCFSCSLGEKGTNTWMVFSYAGIFFFFKILLTFHPVFPPH